MAKIFGKGYYNDWDTMVVGIQVGLQRAFEEACNEVCEKADEIIRGAIYSNNMGETYEPFRTYEMGAISYLTPHISGTECYFSFDNQDIMSLTVDNPPHHGLENYDPESFMIQIINDHDDKEFMNEVKDYIQKEFPIVYRECCRKHNITL
jgi:hypothetical protein